MFEWIAGKAALGAMSGLAGVVTGFVGNLFSQWMNLKMLKEKNQHDKEMLKLRSDATIAEINANIQVTKTQVEGAVDLAEMQAFGDSIKASQDLAFKESYMTHLAASKWTAWAMVPITLGFALVDFLTRLARPLLTYSHVVAVAWLYFLIYNWLRGLEALDTAFLRDLFITSVLSIIYMYSTIVGWWFSDRNASKFIEKHLSGRK